MSTSATPARQPLQTVRATIESLKEGVNTNGKAYVTARAKLANGSMRTIMTYKEDMRALLMKGGAGVTHLLYGRFQDRVFSPIGVAQPRPKAA